MKANEIVKIVEFINNRQEAEPDSAAEDAAESYDPLKDLVEDE